MAKTSLSAGQVLYDVLSGDAGVTAIATKVFPIATDSAELPYVAYRRASIETAGVKTSSRGADTVRIEVNCYAATYQQSVELAEAVRLALDHKWAKTDGLSVSSFTLSDASEFFESDAFVQALTFEARM